MGFMLVVFSSPFLVAFDQLVLKKRKKKAFFWVGCLGGQERVIEVVYVSYYHLLIFFIKRFYLDELILHVTVAMMYGDSIDKLEVLFVLDNRMC